MPDMFHRLCDVMPLNRVMSLNQIYKLIEGWGHMGSEWESDVRKALQADCPQCKQYKGHAACFEWCGRGQWKRIKERPTEDDLEVL